MARGRFISNSLSTSKKFARLATNDHRLMYVMLVTHVDSEGRHDADPRILNGQVYTLLGLSQEQIAAGLTDMHKVGLIRLYAVGDESYLEIAGFREHNKVRRDKDGNPTREAPSSIPPPPGDSGTAPDLLRSYAGVTPAQGLRVKSEELRAKSEVQEELSSPEITKRPATLAATPPRTSHDPGLFMEVWNSNRGRLPAVTTLNAKRKSAIRSLVKEHGPDKALDLFRDATRAVASDEFWLSRQYGLDTLLTGNKVLARAEQWRNGGSQLTTGNARLAKYAATVASAIGGLDDRPN